MRRTAAVLSLLPALLLASPAGHAAGSGVAWNLTPAQADADCERALASARRDADALASGRAAGGLPALDLTVARLNDALTGEKLLGEISADARVRAAAEGCTAKLDAFRVELAADPRVYGLALQFKAVAKEPADQQLAKVYLEEGRMAGAGLDPERRIRATALLKQLDALQAAFFRALGQQHGTVHLSKAEAAVLPPNLQVLLEREGDGFRVPVRLDTYRSFMRSETSGEARRRFDHAFFNIGGQENLKRFQQALDTRRELAKLLGFDSWAALQLDTRMAKSPARAEALLREVDEKLLPKGRAEVAALSALKKADGDDTPFAAWDYAYYEAKLERDRYAVDDEAVRRYFPADRSIPAIMHIYEQLFGLRFQPVQETLWAPGVQEFAIRNAADGRLLGWFFLDLLPRPEKSLRPASDFLRAGHRNADGTFTLPISAIIGNGPAAEAGKPALWGHRDMLELFHEFGHLMHSTLSTVPYAKLYGANVREDFVEAPSQMMENWMWQPAVLKRISSEVDSGRPLPDELIGRLAALEHAADGATWTRQAFFGLYDLSVHGAAPKDALRTWQELQPVLTALPAETGTLPPASFVPLMGGYDAGYYGYIWSRVYAQDMFSAFDGHLMDPVVGLRYRQDVLAPGGSEEPETLVQRFLGRPPSPAAFYRELGLAPETHSPPH